MFRGLLIYGLPLILLAFFPAVARADAGTPLMWATAFHLLIGNAVVGVAEGMLLAWLFRLRMPFCIAVMIAGNYFSAWIGSSCQSRDGKRQVNSIRGSESGSGNWDLVVGSATEESASGGRTLVSELACTAADPPSMGIRPGGEVPRFRQDKSGWEFWFGWMAGNLHGENSARGLYSLVSLETPFLQWPVSSPTQLPSGQIVFQLGRNQICVLDPNERKIALLAKGRWPVVTMDDKRK